MADFNKYTGNESLAGPARLATTATALEPAADPTGVADIIDAPSTYDFVTNPIPWDDAGATNGGIKVTGGHTEFVIKHDLAEEVRSELTDTSMKVETSLAETGDIEKLKRAFVVITDTTGSSGAGDTFVGLGARRSVPERSVVAVHCDQFGKVRCFYFRTVRNVAGDVTLNMASGSMHEAAFNLRAFKRSDAPAGTEFGGIWTQSGYAGIA
jgi:hypothetical protein